MKKILILISTFLLLLSAPILEVRANELIKIGPQVFNHSTIAAKAGMDDANNAYLYVILHGNPSALSVVDLNTNLVKSNYSLENSTSAWGIDVDSNGVVWIGGTTDGALYSYDPNKEKFTNHGDMLAGTKETSIQDLVVNDKYVVGVTAYGATAFKFSKATQKRESILPAMKSKQYAKSVEIDDNSEKLYVGVGSKAELVEWNLKTNVKTPILPTNYKNESYIEKMKIIDNYLLTKLYPSNKAAIYYIPSKRFIKEFDITSRGFSEKNIQRNEFYFTNNSRLYAYNLKTGDIEDTKKDLLKKREALSLDIVKLKNSPDINVLTGLIDNKGSYFIYNPVTQNFEIKNFEVNEQKVNLHLLFESPDRKQIFVNGYMSGGLTRFDPLTRTGIQLNGISQLESAVFLNGKLYVGAYPKARLMEIEINEPWDQSALIGLTSLETYKQERIPALTAGGDNLYAGTYPQYSDEGGLLLIYNTVTKSQQVIRNYIHNQSIITLLQYDGFIYGGTSIHANYQKATDGAKFFRFRRSSPEAKQIIPMPFKSSLITSLISGPNSSIWGAADGTIFAYNPATKQYKTVKLFNAISGKYSNARLTVGLDGFVYGTLEGSFFRINPKTMKHEIISTNSARELVQDANGNMYYRSYADLWMYKITLGEDGEATSTKVVNVNGNVHSGATDAYKVVSSVKSGTSYVTHQNFTNGLGEKWTQITYATGKKGWIRSELFEVGEQVTSTKVVNVNGTVHSGATDAYKVVSSVKSGKSYVTHQNFTNGLGENWTQITYAPGKKGWISSDLFVNSSKVAVVAGSVYSGATTAYKVVSAVKAGTSYATHQNFTNSLGEKWTQITYAPGKKGWLISELLE